jgi:hypothetical protein
VILGGDGAASCGPVNSRPAFAASRNWTREAAADDLSAVQHVGVSRWGGAAEPVGRDLAELDDQELFGRRAFPSTWGPVEPLGRDLVPA